MKRYRLLLITFCLVGTMIMVSATLYAEYHPAFGLEQSEMIQNSPDTEAAGEQDTEPQPEPAPSHGRILPVRK